MEITFLGTGTSQGVPVIGCSCPVCASMDFRDKRLRTSIYIQNGADRIVVDTGPDFRQQMLRERISRLDAVVFTHAHKDHTAGLDDVRSFNHLQSSEMPIYGRLEVLQQIRIEFSYAFGEKKYPGIPQLALKEISEADFTIGQTALTPLPVTHLRLPVLGFRIGEFAYITDANFIPKATYDLLKGVRIMVLNALQQEPHVSHFNLEQALEVAEKIGAEQTWFTHISHRMGLHGATDRELSKGVRLAYDGLRLQV